MKVRNTGVKKNEPCKKRENSKQYPNEGKQEAQPSLISRTVGCDQNDDGKDKGCNQHEYSPYFNEIALSV